MANLRDIRSFIIPSWTQVITSVVISLVYFGLYFHDALTSFLTGAANTNPAYLQQSYNQQISAISQLSFTKELTIGIFWAGVGVVGYFLVITLVNLFIALRNEVVIDRMYAESGGLSSHFIEPMVRLGLIAVFGVGLLITLYGLIPDLWLALMGGLALGGLSVAHVVGAVVAVAGFALNIYVLILLFLAVKDTAEFV